MSSFRSRPGSPRPPSQVRTAWTEAVRAVLFYMVAYGVAMRVYRAGGFTKDAIYLRGVPEDFERRIHAGQRNLA